jgi:hypothetical protein
MLYVVMQDAVGSVTAVDVKTMKATAHYSFIDKGGCNGLALDAKNGILFAACGRSGNPPTQPAQPMMVILTAKDGKILTSLPLAGGSDGAAFNPATMEAFSTHGNGTMTIVKENHERRTDDHLRQQDWPYVYDVAGARTRAASAGNVSSWSSSSTGARHSRIVHNPDGWKVTRPFTAPARRRHRSGATKPKATPFLVVMAHHPLFSNRAREIAKH